MKLLVNIMYHVLFWIVLVLVFALTEWGPDTSLKQSLTLELLNLPARLIFVYINWFLFLPILIKERKTTAFTVYFISLLTVFAFAQRVLFVYWGYPEFFPDLIGDRPTITFFKPTRILQIALTIFIPAALTTGWKLYKDYRKRRDREVILEMEKREAELNYLKSQINPHFLFNTLNTIYSLSLEKSPKVPKLLLKLSDFLSFSLYETKYQKIPIHREIDLINNFIEIQKDRFVNRVEIHSAIEIENEQIEIPPMLLIIFVENAFKHSLRNETGIAKINYKLKTTQNTLLLEVENSHVKTMTQATDVASGIGLKNIRRRLDLLYQNNHSLEIQNTDHKFKVTLVLNNLDNEN